MSFDPEQVRIGTEIEKEHTDDPAKAERIAKDHLRENPRYYPTGKMPKGRKEALRYVESILREADELLPTPEDDEDDVELTDVEPAPVESPTDHIPCHEICQICGKNACTLMHRRADQGHDRDWSPYKHMCQACDQGQFAAMLNRLM